jgi:histone deacetylase 8
LIVEKEIKNDIPEHEHFLEYGPDYELDITQGKLRNKNTEESVEKLIDSIQNNLSNVMIE